jgi:hypothetical protein
LRQEMLLSGAGENEPEPETLFLQQQAATGDLK